jgi:ubiquinone/menaquinone biosynthesis C-methylase UbiE
MTVATPDPKAFYNEVMPSKIGTDYEHARWHSSSLLSAQYWMMQDVLNRWVLPGAQQAGEIVEVGPGPGVWTKVLLGANPSAHYTLVDISREMLSRAREALAGRTNIEFLETDFLALESKQPFDFFFSSRAIEYMPDKKAVVQKISSLLSPGARGALITKMPKPLFDFVRGRSSRAFHSAQISPRALIALCLENGLVVENVRVATATVPFFGFAGLNKIVYQLLRYIPLFFPLSLFVESYVVTFRKP